MCNLPYLITTGSFGGESRSFAGESSGACAFTTSQSREHFNGNK